MDFPKIESDLNDKMNKTLDVLKKEFTGLRTGRASVNLLDPIVVSAYGSTMPLNQVASLSIPDARTISVSVWDKGMVDAVVKAIAESGMGLNPQNDGTLVRIPLPPLNEERRKELSKVAGKYAEDCKTSIRNIRRDGMDSLKKAEKEKEISEDEQKSYGDDIQKLTDKMTAEIDELLKKKEADIMAV